MDKLGRSVLLNSLKWNTFYKIPIRYRRTNRRIIESFENEEDYIKQLKQDKKVLKKRTETQQSTEKKLTANDSYDSDWCSVVPKDILNLKFEKPNPAKIGSFSKMMLNMKSKSYRCDILS